MYHGSDELDLLLHSLRQLLGSLLFPIAELQFSEPPIDAHIGFLASNILQLGKETKLLADFHLLIKPALFRQVSDAILQGGRHSLAQQLNTARVRDRDVDDHANRRSFAGAVWTD